MRRLLSLVLRRATLPLVAVAVMSGGAIYAADPPSGQSAEPQAAKAPASGQTAEPQAAKAPTSGSTAPAAKETGSAGSNQAVESNGAAKASADQNRQGAARSQNREPGAAGDAAKGTRDANRGQVNRDRGDRAGATRTREETGTREIGGRDERRERRSLSVDTRRENRRETRRTSKSIGIEFGRVTDRGLTVSQLAAGSVAFRAGLRNNDVIVSINGQAVHAIDDFDRLVFVDGRRERVEIVVLRGGREETIILEPSAVVVDTDVVVDDDLRTFGVVLDDHVTDRVVILEVIPDSPAFVAGLRAGDVITVWHGHQVSSPRDFIQMVGTADAGVVDFEFSRDSKTVRAEANISGRESSRSTTTEKSTRQSRETKSSATSEKDRTGAAVEPRSQRRDGSAGPNSAEASTNAGKADQNRQGPRGASGAGAGGTAAPRGGNQPSDAGGGAGAGQKGSSDTGNDAPKDKAGI